MVLSRLTRRQDKGLTVDAALRDVKSVRRAARLTAVAALGAVEGKRRGEAVAALREALGDDEALVRAEAAIALGDLSATEAIDALIDLCGDERSGEARQGAVLALGKLGDEAASETLMRCSADPEADVRFQAVTALALVAPTECPPRLLELLEDEDAEVRGSAAAALGDLGYDDAVDSIAALLVDSDPATRLEAAVALARLGDGRAQDVLARHLSHRDFGVLAARQLFERPAPSAADALRTQLGRWLGDPVVRVYVAAALVRLDGDDAGREALAKALASGKPNLRGLAIELLGVLCSAEDVAAQARPWAAAELESFSASADSQAWQEELDLAKSGGVRRT